MDATAFSAPLAPQHGAAIPDHLFRVPDDLSPDSIVLKNILLIGSCITDTWIDVLTGSSRSRKVERVLFNNAGDIDPISESKARSFDAQIISLPLRSVWPEALTFALEMDDVAGWRAAQSWAFDALQANFTAALRHHREHRLQTYVLGFLAPQQNTFGRNLRPRALSNPAVFVRQLNWRLQDLILAIDGCEYIDIDEIASCLGKRYILDDSTLHSNHHGLLADIFGDADREHIEPLGDVEILYTPKRAEFIRAVMQEVEGVHRTIRRINPIKIVIFDLDDTLWRGVAGEMDSFGPEMIEGWPLGVVEALTCLHKRGVMLALCSKNDEAVVRAAWDTLYSRLLPFERFVMTRIGWSPKAHAVGEILRGVNVLPENALFIDDNPVERAAVEHAFPQIRTLDPPLATWRRRLLWAPELQTTKLTAEARNRTEMVRAQVHRDEVRAGMNEADFLQTLELSITLSSISGSADAQFERALELINKTNQFNSTGRRWERGELADFLNAGGRLLAATARDRFTAYGLVGVVALHGRMIEQLVLSCRVFGMGIERTLLAHALQTISEAGHSVAEARLQATARNAPCLPLLPASGFAQTEEGLWRRAVEPALANGRHAALTVQGLTG